MGPVTKRIETYNVQVSDTKGSYTIPLSANRIHRAELLSVEKPNYREMIGKYRHLEGVDTEDTDTKSLLPVHVILGASDYAKIKTSKPQRTGAPGEPVAEFTLFGWTIMSPRTTQNLDSIFLTQTTSTSYEDLCRMDVLGLKDKSSEGQSVVYEGRLVGDRPSLERRSSSLAFQQVGKLEATRKSSLTTEESRKA